MIRHIRKTKKQISRFQLQDNQLGITNIRNLICYSVDNSHQQSESRLLDISITKSLG